MKVNDCPFSKNNLNKKVNQITIITQTLIEKMKIILFVLTENEKNTFVNWFGSVVNKNLNSCQNFNSPLKQNQYQI